MTRTHVGFSVDDISTFAKALRRQLDDRMRAAPDRPPGHVELLNMLARSAGHGNFQALRCHALTGGAAEPAPQPLPAEAPAEADLARVERTRRHFDVDGRLIRWPSRRSQQLLALWALWAAFPARTSLDDAGVKAFLAARHIFGDHALLRRELVDSGLVTRSADGRDYRRIERQPPDEALALIRSLPAAADPLA